MEIVLSAAIFLALGYASLLLYYGAVWRSINTYTPAPKSKEEKDLLNAGNNFVSLPPSISVIIPARNEAQQIGHCLDSLMQQTYPRHLFEVLVVDDHSEDDTPMIIKEYSAKNVTLISLKDHITAPINSYKKKAVETAVARAVGTLIVTTDADCYLPEKWLETIAAFYMEKKPAFIAAPVKIDCGFRFIEIFQALDFMSLQGITGAVVSKNQMTMCNGANMAYERSAFSAVNGFSGIDTIASGDDMLLMHKIYKRFPDRVMFLKSPDAIVQTSPVKTIKQFFSQRVRWASKADKYDDKRILPVLLLVYVFNCLLLALPVLSIFQNGRVHIAGFYISTVMAWLIILGIKTVSELIFLYPVATFFQKKSLLWLFPLMQPFHILYTVIAGFLGKFHRYNWKDRTVS